MANLKLLTRNLTTAYRLGAIASLLEEGILPQRNRKLKRMLDFNDNDKKLIAAYQRGYTDMEEKK